MRLLRLRLRQHPLAGNPHERVPHRLRLDPSGIDVWSLREHAADALGRVSVDQVDMLVLDATPVDSLVDHLTHRHDRLPDIHAEVALPPNVKVVQYAERPNGHRCAWWWSLKRHDLPS